MSKLRFDRIEVMYTNPDAGVTVTKAILQDSVTMVAVKEEIFPDLQGANSAIQEGMSMMQIMHENVCRIFDCALEQVPTGVKSIIIVELLESDLSKQIAIRTAAQQYWSEEELMDYLYRLVDALAFAQCRMLSHRDIKPQNIFCSANGRVIKLGDFGSSKRIFESEIMTKSIVGSPFFLSPQLKQMYTKSLNGIDEGAYNPFKSDVYSLGVVFLYLARLKAPSELMNTEQLPAATAKLMQEISGYPTLCSILSMMLEIQEDQRVDFIQLQQVLINLKSQQSAFIYPPQPPPSSQIVFPSGNAPQYETQLASAQRMGYNYEQQCDSVGPDPLNPLLPLAQEQQRQEEEKFLQASAPYYSQYPQSDQPQQQSQFREIYCTVQAYPSLPSPQMFTTVQPAALHVGMPTSGDAQLPGPSYGYGQLSAPRPPQSFQVPGTSTCPICNKPFLNEGGKHMYCSTACNPYKPKSAPVSATVNYKECASCRNYFVDRQLPIPPDLSEYVSFASSVCSLDCLRKFKEIAIGEQVSCSGCKLKKDKDSFVLLLQCGHGFHSKDCLFSHLIEVTHAFTLLTQLLCRQCHQQFHFGLVFHAMSRDEFNYRQREMAKLACSTCGSYDTQNWKNCNHRACRNHLQTYCFFCNPIKYSS